MLLQVRERGGPVAAGDWCRDLSPGCSSPPGPADVVQFPYAILEVKLQVEAPQWVKVRGTGAGLPLLHAQGVWLRVSGSVCLHAPCVCMLRVSACSVCLHAPCVCN